MNNGHRFQSDVCTTPGIAEIDATVEQLPQAEMLGERGRQNQSRVSDQMFIIEDHIETVEAVRRSHLKGALQEGLNVAVTTIILPA